MVPSQRVDERIEHRPHAAGRGRRHRTAMQDGQPHRHPDPGRADAGRRRSGPAAARRSRPPWRRRHGACCGSPVGAPTRRAGGRRSRRTASASAASAAVTAAGHLRPVAGRNPAVGGQARRRHPAGVDLAEQRLAVEAARDASGPHGSGQRRGDTCGTDGRLGLAGAQLLLEQRAEERAHATAGSHAVEDALRGAHPRRRKVDGELVSAAPRQVGAAQHRRRHGVTDGWRVHEPSRAAASGGSEVMDPRVRTEVHARRVRLPQLGQPLGGQRCDPRVETVRAEVEGLP